MKESEYSVYQIEHMMDPTLQKKKQYIIDFFPVT
jgi:hypothetical protein